MTNCSISRSENAQNMSQNGSSIPEQSQSVLNERPISTLQVTLSHAFREQTIPEQQNDPHFVAFAPTYQYSDNNQPNYAGTTLESLHFDPPPPYPGNDNVKYSAPPPPYPGASNPV